MAKRMFDVLIGILILFYITIRHYPYGGAMQTILDILCVFWIVLICSKLIIYSFKK